MNEPVTIGERYRKATGASNLRVDPIRQGDVDLLIAAGWSDSLGIMLYRLAGEFDQVAQDVRRAGNQTDAIMVLSRIKTLTPVRIALVRFAMDSLQRWRINLDENTAAILVGRALNAWLDPNCPSCGGTGTIGGYDGKVINICRECSGSGKSEHKVGKTENERNFASLLIRAMDSKMSEGEALLRKFTRQSTYGGNHA